MFSLPDELLNIIDEFSDARSDALDNKVECEQLYDDCPAETVTHIMMKIRKLM